VSGFRADNQIFSRDRFLSNGVNYEKDVWGLDRYYRLEESRSLRREMDGALVRRRISRAACEEAYRDCQRRIVEYDAWALSLKGGVA
jgi:hypothetical protein